jgi:hypothetical protein
MGFQVSNGQFFVQAFGKAAHQEPVFMEGPAARTILLPHI